MAYEYENLFLQDSVKKELFISYDSGVITNAELHSNQFELVESICSDNELRFGGCEASVIRFKISNVFESLNGKDINVSMVLNGHSDIPYELGKFKIYSDIPTADRNFRDIVAYDKMYEIINANVAEWYNNLEFPITLKEFRTSFINFFGLNQTEVVLCNDSMIIEKTVEVEELSGQAVATAICEINGCFGHIDRNGDFEYIVLESSKQVYPSNELFPSDEIFPGGIANYTQISKKHYISCQYEDFVTSLIECVEVRPEEESAGAITGNVDGNVYVVHGNILLNGKSTDELLVVAENLFNVIKNVEYRPCQVSAIGVPTIHLGEYISLITKYETVSTYVLQRTLSGIQSLRDLYTSEGVKEYSEDVNSVKNDVIKLKSKVNVLDRNVERTLSQIEDVGKGLRSEIEQTSEQLKVELRDEINEKGASILADSEKIVMSVTEDYVEKTAFDNYKQTTSAEFEIYKDGIGISFEQVSEKIDETDEKVNEKFEVYNKVIRFDSENGIEITDKTNSLSLTIDADGISFKKNGLEFGYWDGVDFHTGNIVVDLGERAQFGGFAFVPRSDGSLMFLKVGD